MSNARTVVIGGGVIGAATAYYLATSGSSVTLLEQGDVGSGCSQGNAGQVTPGHLPLPQPGQLWRNIRWLFSSKSPLYVAPRFDPELVRWLVRFQRACTADHLREATRMLCRLGAASERLYDELARELGIPYTKSGRLEIARTERSLRAIREEADLLREFGFPSQHLKGGEVRAFEPAIGRDVAGGVCFPDSGSCNPLELVRRLIAGAERAGAVVRRDAPVSDVRVERERVAEVVVDGEPVAADSIVLACGSWTPRLARRLGLRLPIQPGKGYHLDIDRPDPCPAIPVVLMEERIFVTPMDGFLRLAGTMEFSGFNLDLRPTRVAMLAAGAERYFLGSGVARERSRWCHLRPMTPDGLPVVGKVPGLHNAWIAAGHGMLGVTQGPFTGKLIADWIRTGNPEMDLDSVSPARFARGGRIGRIESSAH
ncbi:MAG: FAD-dependent oxidoreductase [Planctomycetes bacterium]|nr:FAD-dependent oxidoreductase [Planctomycetota bacterium]